MVGVAVLGIITNIVILYTFSEISEYTVKTISNQVLKKILNMPMSWFAK